MWFASSEEDVVVVVMQACDNASIGLALVVVVRVACPDPHHPCLLVIGNSGSIYKLGGCSRWRRQHQRWLLWWMVVGGDLRAC